MRRNLSRRATLAIVAALFAASCSGSNEAASTTTEDLSRRPGATGDVSEPTSTETTTTAEAATTTEPEPVATTEPAPPATEAATTTAAEPATTTVPSAAESDEEQGVVDAVAFFEEQWRSCVSAVPSCDVNTVGARRQVDEANLAVSEAVRFNNNDYRISNIDQLSYRVDDVTIADDATTAQATVCVTDPIVVTEADGTIVDDRFLSSTQQWDFALDDEMWTLAARTIVGDIAEGADANVCT